MFPNPFKRIERFAEKKNTVALLSMLHDSRETVRLAAIRALGWCVDDDAFNALAPLLHASESSVRRTAALALGDMGRPDGCACIERQMRVEKDEQVLSAMRVALCRRKIAP